MIQVGPAVRGCHRLLLALVGVVALLVLVPAAPAQAHSGLVSSNPADRTVLPAAPETANLTFNERVRPVVASFQLYDATGKRQLEVAAVDQVVEVRLPAGLVDGTYVLSWRVISADSHPIAGALSFSVGQPSSRPPAAADLVSGDGRVDLAYLFAQVAAYLGLLAAVGLTAFQVAVLRSAGVARARERLLLVAVVTTLIGHGALLPLTRLRGQGLSLGSLMDPGFLRSTLGSAPALALALVVLGGAALLVRPRLRRTWSQRGLASLGAGLALAAVLPVGHTRTAVPTAVVMGADLVHALAGAVWFGGVIGLGMFLASARRVGTPAGEAAVTVRRFSGLAGLLVAALGVSGLILGVLIMGSLSALTETNYGRTLLVKLGFVAVIGLLALWNRAYLVPAVERPEAPQEQWRRLTGAVRDEVALLVAVIGVTGLLVMQSPIVAEDPTAPTVVAGSFRSALGRGTVQGTITPVRPGVNEFEFAVRDADGGEMPSIELPKVTASLPEAGLGPLVASVTRIEGSGGYRAELTLPTDGQWRFNVSVRVDKFTNLTAQQAVVVNE